MRRRPAKGGGGEAKANSEGRPTGGEKQVLKHEDSPLTAGGRSWSQSGRDGIKSCMVSFPAWWRSGALAQRAAGVKMHRMRTHAFERLVEGEGLLCRGSCVVWCPSGQYLTSRGQTGDEAEWVCACVAATRLQECEGPPGTRSASLRAAEGQTGAKREANVNSKSRTGC